MYCVVRIVCLLRRYQYNYPADCSPEGFFGASNTPICFAMVRDYAGAVAGTFSANDGETKWIYCSTRFPNAAGWHQ
jgi:hypothetical protein